MLTLGMNRWVQQVWTGLRFFLAYAFSAPQSLARYFSRRIPATDEEQDAPKPIRPSPPRNIRYRPIPGSWERIRHPHWPDRVFKIPEQKGEGDIFYITKGDCIRMGGTAFVELLPSGHVAKTPKVNPYYPEREKQNHQSMQREALIYELVGPSPFIPDLVSWDPESHVLTLKNCTNGDLESYIRKAEHESAIGLDTRRRWALQAAKALAILHARGVVHNDIAPRNFLLDENLDLRICDFAGCSLPNETSCPCAPGPRYEARPWTRDCVPTQADDIFALGSVLYFIMSGEEPYSDLEDEEVERRFADRHFPKSSHLDCGAAIQDCWLGHFVEAEQVVEALGGSH